MRELIENYWLYFLVGQYPNGPLGGLSLTVLLGSAAMLLAFPVGVALGLARVSGLSYLRWPVTVLIYVVRGTPLLMVVFWAYFFLPSITGHKTDQFTTMLVALIVFNGAYIAEIVRAGIQGIPKGQMESARSLGMSYPLAMRRVVLPQALRNMRPSLINQFVSTLKETSLGYIIGLTEVSFIASQINAQVLTQSLQVYGVLAAAYFILCFGLSRIAQLIETRSVTRT
jgi:polar amino acid transport system permease protein